MKIYYAKDTTDMECNLQVLPMIVRAMGLWPIALTTKAYKNPNLREEKYKQSWFTWFNKYFGKKLYHRLQ